MAIVGMKEVGNTGSHKDRQGNRAAFRGGSFLYIEPNEEQIEEARKKTLARRAKQLEDWYVAHQTILTCQSCLSPPPLVSDNLSCQHKDGRTFTMKDAKADGYSPFVFQRTLHQGNFSCHSCERKLSIPLWPSL